MKLNSAVNVVEYRPVILRELLQPRSFLKYENPQCAEARGSNFNSARTRSTAGES